MEAEFHYDFESPFWLKYMSEKKYTPGSGMAFGLGMMHLSIQSVIQISDIVETGTHSLDQALTLFGRPKSVTAFFRTQRGIESEVEDAFTIILQYEDELLVTVKTTTTTPMPQQLKLFVRGREGSYIKVRSMLKAL